jgi:hypothetical protein
VLQVSVETTRPLPGGTQVDEVLEFVTGQTLEMTGADWRCWRFPAKATGS